MFAEELVVFSFFWCLLLRLPFLIATGVVRCTDDGPSVCFIFNDDELRLPLGHTLKGTHEHLRRRGRYARLTNVEEECVVFH